MNGHGTRKSSSNSFSSTATSSASGAVSRRRKQQRDAWNTIDTAFSQSDVKDVVRILDVLDEPISIETETTPATLSAEHQVPTYGIGTPKSRERCDDCGTLVCITDE